MSRSRPSRPTSSVNPLWSVAGTLAGRYGPTVANAVGNYLFQKPKARPTPAKILADTRFRSYLDRRYQRKCGVEVKEKYTGAGSSTAATTLTSIASPFMGIAQGQTNSTRIGDNIEVKKMVFRFRVRSGASSTLPSLVRLIIVKQDYMEGAVTSSADVLQTTTDIQSFYAQDKNEGFTVLLDKVFKVTPVSTADGDNVKTYQFTYKPKHCHAIQWLAADTTGAIANCIKGNINIKAMYWSAGAVAPEMEFSSLCQYIDV